MNNLSIAFPEKSAKEKWKIAVEFYRNLTDTFIETIKILSLSEKKFHQMATIDLSQSIAVAQKGKSIQFHAGHQFNWEFANLLIAEQMPIPFIGIYKKISNKHFNKLFFDLRSKKGTVLIATHEFRNKMHQLLSSQYSIGFAADQNPGNPQLAYWCNFFGKPVPFATGPDKSAIKNNTAVVFLKLIKISRGKYHFSPGLIIEDTSILKPGELTLMYRDFLETTIRECPHNYLWSHRRWRWEYSEEFASKWIDKKIP
jgi:KDO2-lipid IV(A) lauroyltransferase